MRGSRQHDDGSLDNILNTTLGFQKIYVINLPRRTDHRDQASLAAHLTDLQIEYIDGVTEVEEKTLPLGGDAITSEGAIGAWRAHANVYRAIVENNITSALVLEDDSDWDIRIKSQMQEFAKASRLLVQPLQGTTDKFLDPTYYSFDAPVQRDFYVGEHTTTTPTNSPYGDTQNWDYFWLGHCGAKFPQPSDAPIPQGRAVLLNDQTVPEKQHIDAQFGDGLLTEEYPEHTRVISRVHDNVCTSAYAITLEGARRYLYELAINKFDKGVDLMMGDMCEGRDGRPMRTCLSVHPQLFQHHRPIARKTSFSDIGDLSGEGYSEQAFTRNIRWATRVNFQALVYGSTDYVDLFPDGGERPDLHT
ncbi:hypothetical protein LTR62_006533 [Meristemomyces frigidus]|uniref:Glycosyl transferase family 25 domain-containing protein n=1 Tax=Meristemomyces frigidus TaxID=1508187 RepID=A0AAN7TCD7_9PEZI|nr:hypothetical protein LTR62_006533 [Meristemomyces frigidus]